jgi:hypothetical protein
MSNSIDQNLNIEQKTREIEKELEIRLSEYLHHADLSPFKYQCLGEVTKLRNILKRTNRTSRH